VAIDPADAKTPKLSSFNQPHHLPVGCGSGGGKRFEVAQNAGTVPEIAASQLTHDEWMRQSQPIV